VKADKRTLQEKVERPAKDGDVVASVGDKDAEGERKFYVTMVRGDRVARLAGPFDTKAEADAMVSRAQQAANDADPRSAFDAFGVSAVTSTDHKPGTLNERLGIGSTKEPAQPQEAASPQEKAKEAEKPAGKIEDFGEKLAGARKDYAAKMKDAEAVDIASEPLSKSWPEPDYQKLLDNGADPFIVAFIHAARDEVPTKPQKAWKLKGWVSSVETLRGAASS
jgi:hypothetical protein